MIWLLVIVKITRKDDERFIALKKFVQEELKYIQGKWTELRIESGEEKAKELLPVIDTWCKSLQGDDKKYAKKCLERSIK